MILKCVLGVVARLKSRRNKSSVFTLVGLHTRRLSTTAKRFRVSARHQIPEMPFANRVDRRIWWLTVSKAADRSSKIGIEDLESALASLRASTTERKAVSVECPHLFIYLFNLWKNSDTASYDY